MSLKPSKSFMKFIGLMALFSLAPVSLYIVYTRTGGPASDKEQKFQKNLRYAFMQGEDAIDLAPLVDWPYIKVCALDSGLTRGDVTKVLGFDYQYYDQMTWLPLTGYWTLVFVDKEREASWGMARPVTTIRIPRKDLADLRLPASAKGACITHDGRVEISRRGVPVGESPIVVQMVNAQPD